MQDGLNQRNSSSVDDFLSLIAAGDIPHQDANLLNVPLMQQHDAATKLLASQSFSNMKRANNVGEGSSRGGLDDTSFSSNYTMLSNSASAVAMAMARVRAAIQNNAAGTSNNNKPHNECISGEMEQQGESKQ